MAKFKITTCILLLISLSFAVFADEDGCASSCPDCEIECHKLGPEVKHFCRIVSPTNTTIKFCTCNTNPKKTIPICKPDSGTNQIASATIIGALMLIVYVSWKELNFHF